MVIIWECKRCEGEWAGRGGEKPLRCARCGSPYWDRERGVKAKAAPVSNKAEKPAKVKKGAPVPVIKEETPEKSTHPKAAVIAAFKSALGMTTLGEGVPEKIDWLEEEGDGEGIEMEAGAIASTAARAEGAGEAKQGEDTRTDSGGADPVQGSEPGILPLSGRNPSGASEAPPVRDRAPGVVPVAPVVTPVYESVPQEVERRTKEVCDRDPEANPDAVRPHVEMLVKNERRRQKAAAAPDYDTGSQEVRRGRRRG